MTEEPRRPVPPAHEHGLCPRCRHVKVLENDRGSVFLRCGASGPETGLPKYPPQPVVACPSFTE